MNRWRYFHSLLKVTSNITKKINVFAKLNVWVGINKIYMLTQTTTEIICFQRDAWRNAPSLWTFTKWHINKSAETTFQSYGNRMGQSNGFQSVIFGLILQLMDSSPWLLMIFRSYNLIRYMSGIRIWSIFRPDISRNKFNYNLITYLLTILTIGAVFTLRIYPSISHRGCCTSRLRH